MSDTPSRRYKAAELNELLQQLRRMSSAHEPSIQVLLTMALLLEQIHDQGLFMDPAWGDVVPVLHHEILKRTAQALSSDMAVDHSGGDWVH